MNVRRTVLFALLVVGFTLPLCAQPITPTNETLIFDANGKNMGALVFDRLRFRLQDGRNVMLKIFPAPEMSYFGWVRDDAVYFVTSDCTGQYFIKNVSHFADSVAHIIDGRYELVIWDGQPAEAHTFLSWMDNTGACWQSNFADSMYAATMIVDLNTVYTPPFHMGGRPVPATQTFSDVPSTAIYYEAVESISAAQVTSGCAQGLYCPNAYVTRAQMALFLARALGLKFAPAP